MCPKDPDGMANIVGIVLKAFEYTLYVKEMKLPIFVN